MGEKSPSNLHGCNIENARIRRQMSSTSRLHDRRQCSSTGSLTSSRIQCIADRGHWTTIQLSDEDATVL